MDIEYALIFCTAQNWTLTVLAGTNSPELAPDPNTVEKESMEQFILKPYYGISEPFSALQSVVTERFRQTLGEGGERELFRRVVKGRRSYFWSPLPVSINNFCPSHFN